MGTLFTDCGGVVFLKICALFFEFLSTVIPHRDWSNEIRYQWILCHTEGEQTLARSSIFTLKYKLHWNPRPPGDTMSAVVAVFFCDIFRFVNIIAPSVIEQRSCHVSVFCVIYLPYDIILWQISFLTKNYRPHFVEPQNLSSLPSPCAESS